MRGITGRVRRGLAKGRLSVAGLTAVAVLLGAGQWAAPASAAERPAFTGGLAAAAGTFDPSAAQQQRQDVCLLARVARLGGPAMRQVAEKGLAGDTAAQHAAAAPDYWNDTPLSTAFAADRAAAESTLQSLNARAHGWQAPLASLSTPGGFTDASFRWIPSPDFFHSAGLSPWLAQQFWTSESTFYVDPTPLAGKATADATTTLGNTRYPKNPDASDYPDMDTFFRDQGRDYQEWRAWQDMTFMHDLFADESRLLLQRGGFARSAPDPRSVEFRVDVEDLKTRFAGCEWRNPQDPNGVLGLEVQAAAEEWQAELDAQRAPRGAILAANLKATAALSKGADALGEILGQSWIADHASRWQAYWGAGGPGTAGSGSMTVQLKAATTLCLEPNGSTAAGTKVQANTCNKTSTAQMWAPVGNNPLDGPLSNRAASKCLDLSGTSVVIAACSTTKATQEWKYTTTFGQTQLLNVGANKCLDFAKAAKGQAAVVKACGSAVATQQFVTQQDNKGTGTGTDSLGYPEAAEFTQAAKAVKDAQAAAKAQLALAQAQLPIAATAAADTAAAQQQAYAIADAAGAPRGRALLSAQQAAQVTAASVAALKAVAAAAQTANQAATASAGAAATLQQLAQTQGAAAAAAFRTAAAQEADAQAKAAAAGAAEQAKVAAAANAKAQSALSAALSAEGAAKQAADVAHAKRLAAESEQATAAANRAQAASYQARAATDRATAQTQQQNADAALARAQAAGATAARKRADAEQADADATLARQQAWNAAHEADAMTARARAADAYAAAHAAGADAEQARAAANQAHTAANDAAAAASKAKAAADDASAAARAAGAAATRAEAAATRAQSDANAAQAAKADADAAVQADEVAVADAVAASADAATAAGTAQQAAAVAQQQAVTSRQNADAAGADARTAQADAATTAGYAYTTARAATAAADAAAVVTQPANDAIQLGSPYVETDSSAGLAVLTAQGSKSIAEQQQAVAQAKAKLAQQAATSAQALADAATGDAKNAALAAADAAVQAAAAQASAAQAVASAAAAQKAAAAAEASLARARAYDAQATADASAAQAAATAAQSDAAAARASATQAETDAAAARAAAAAAQAAASKAHDVAVKADRDAAAAEAAAKDAEQQAASAQQAVIAAEQAAQAKADAAALTVNNPTGLAGVRMVPHITGQEVLTPVECIYTFTDIGHCTATIRVHITGTIDYLAVGCPDPTSTSCPGQEVTSLLQTVPLDTIISRDQVFSTLKIIGEFWKNVALAMVSDFIGCAHGNLTDCAWAVGSIVVPYGLGKIARAVMAMRVASRTGAGWAEALAGLEAAGLDARAMAELRAGTNDLLKSCNVVPHSFAGATPVVMADGSLRPISEIAVGEIVRTADPDTGLLVTGMVTHRWVHHDRDLTDVTVLDGSGRLSVLHTTSHHPFWDATRRAWIGAAGLSLGDRLGSLDGHEATVAGVTSFNAVEVTYDLTVEAAHTYYVVAGNTPVLVHNCNGLTDMWQVWDRVMGKDGHVMTNHGYGTPAVSPGGTVSKFGADVTGDMVVDQVVAGVSDATYRGAAAAGTHYHLYDTGIAGFGTVDGRATSWIKIYVYDTGELGTAFPVLPPSA